MVSLNSVRLLPTCALGVMMLAGGSNIASAAGEVAAIGVVDDVRNEAFGTVPGSQPARLVLDKAVHRDEHVKTGNDALLRVVFADSTTLLLGANSEMNLDRFIYSGTKGTGQAVMKMSSGIFRFVSGNIDKKGVALVTPLATIGIRGTDFIVDVAPNGTTRVSVLSGLVEMQSLNGGGVVAIAPGQVGTFEAGQKAARLDLCAGGNCAAALRADVRTRDLVQPSSATARASTMQAINQGSLASAGQADMTSSGRNTDSSSAKSKPMPKMNTLVSMKPQIGKSAQHGNRDGNSYDGSTAAPSSSSSSSSSPAAAEKSDNPPSP